MSCRPCSMFCLPSLAMFLLLFLPGCSGKDDLSGDWQGKLTLAETGKSLTGLKFKLVRQGQEVTGMMIFTQPGAKLPLKGTATGAKLSLSSPLLNGLAVTISGTLIDPRTIKGTALLDYNTPQLGRKQDKAQLEMTR